MEKHVLAVLYLVLGLQILLSFADPSHLLGGGNFSNGATDQTIEEQFAALGAAGATRCRMNLYPGAYYDDSTGKVITSLDAAIIQAFKYGVTPMVLFEYYQGFPNPVGPYSKWFAIGQTFASRYSPNSQWLKSNNISNFGVTIFTAFNEPEETNLPYTLYYYALLGLADGVHSVSPSFHVNPGGFKNANAYMDWKLDGYGTTLTPLWNNGTLDGIDLHTYYDYIYAPMEGTYIHSAQSNYIMVKHACNVTRDINFYTTEFNYKRYSSAWNATVQALITEDFAAAGFLTGFWDNVGVVRADGTSATQFAFVWNIFNTNTSDISYGICSTLSPWTPIARGQTLKMVLALTKNFEFTKQDPLTTGVYILQDNMSQTLVVWQNRVAWSNLLGTSFVIDNISSRQTWLGIYGWNELLSGATSYKVGNLSENETYMFLLSPQKPQEL